MLSTPANSTERSRQSAALEAARTILAESTQVKEAATSTNSLKSLLDWAFSQRRKGAGIALGCRSNEQRQGRGTDAVLLRWSKW
jgi:hypothetical protein